MQLLPVTSLTSATVAFRDKGNEWSVSPYRIFQIDRFGEESLVSKRCSADCHMTGDAVKDDKQKYTITIY